MNGGENTSGVVYALRLGSFAEHYITKWHTQKALLPPGVIREPRPTKEGFPPYKISLSEG